MPLTAEVCLSASANTTGGYAPNGPGLSVREGLLELQIILGVILDWVFWVVLDSHKRECVRLVVAGVQRRTLD